MARIAETQPPPPAPALEPSETRGGENARNDQQRKLIGLTDWFLPDDHDCSREDRFMI